jgi:carbon storage regulator
VLIITRKPGDRIMVGDDIVLHVLEVAGGSVRIGIEAPRALPVYREEIWEAVRRESGPTSPPAAA